MTTPAASPAVVGIGLKPQYVAEILGSGVPLDFFEVHAENYMVPGGPYLRHLEQIRAGFPLSLHRRCRSTRHPAPRPPRDPGGALRAPVVLGAPGLVEPRRDLLQRPPAGPLRRRQPGARLRPRRVCAHIDQVQERLGRRLLLENPSTYLAFAASTLEEGDFLAQIVRRTGCGLLLDVNNAYVSAVNQGRDPWDLIAGLPPDAVGEIHLAGFAEDRDGAGDRLLIDTHGAPVDEAVWALYRRTLAHLGPRPTLIERDQAIPPLEVLVAEASRARSALESRPVAAGARS